MSKRKARLDPADIAKRIQETQLHPLEQQKDKLMQKVSKIEKQIHRHLHRIRCIEFIQQQAITRLSWQEDFPYLVRQIEIVGKYKTEDFQIPLQWGSWLKEDLACHAEFKDYMDSHTYGGL